jgi:hypothetical protein
MPGLEEAARLSPPTPGAGVAEPAGFRGAGGCDRNVAVLRGTVPAHAARGHNMNWTREGSLPVRNRPVFAETVV